LLTIESRAFGIVNGTCNYILTKMSEEEEEFAIVRAVLRNKDWPRPILVLTSMD
jgi:hypothetical protein